MIREITPSDPEWPQPLRHLSASKPPSKLYVAGRPLELGRLPIAVVGTRRPTTAGIQAAEQLSRGIAEAGFVVVSGMALGIDSAAHRAALDAGGRTIAVLGCGIDVNYPNRNSRLRTRMLTDASVVSEYAPGTQPQRGYFPARNRIIAGLSKGVIVVEGGFKSGALITARLALDENRSVFAVPGSIRNAMAAAPNELIRTSRAGLVTSIQHVFEDLVPGLVWSEVADEPHRGAASLQPDELAVLELLDDVPAAPDKLCDALDEAPGKIAIALSRLEVRGLVVRRSAGYEISSSGARARALAASEEAAKV